MVSDVLEHCAEDMEFFSQRIDQGVMARLETIRSKDFIRLPYTEAIEIIRNSGRKFDYAVEWGSDLQTEHERFLTEEHFGQPVILFNYPRTLKPFYMRLQRGREDGAGDGRPGTRGG